MTYRHLTASRGEELLTLYLAGFPAKTLAQPEKEKASVGVEAQCGNTWQESLEKSNQLTFLPKTPLCSALEDSVLSSKTLPKWGMMLNGECFQQPMLAQTTRERESGFWATPTRCDYKGTTGAANFQSRKKQFQDLTDGEMVIGTIYPNPITYEAMMGWPLEWTDLKPSATDKSLCVPQQPLNSLKTD